jgi:hypothetical protein
LEIHEETEGQAGGSQIIETLRHGFVGEAFDIFQFQYQHVLDDEIGIVFPNRLAFR